MMVVEVEAGGGRVLKGGGSVGGDSSWCFSNDGDERDIDEWER